MFTGLVLCDHRHLCHTCLDVPCLCDSVLLCVCVCVCVCVPAVKHPYFLIRVCAVSAVNFQTANLIPDLRGGRATSAISGVTHLCFSPASSLLFTFSSETLLD